MVTAHVEHPLLSLSFSAPQFPTRWSTTSHHLGEIHVTAMAALCLSSPCDTWGYDMILVQQIKLYQKDINTCFFFLWDFTNKNEYAWWLYNDFKWFNWMLHKTRWSPGSFAKLACNQCNWDLYIHIYVNSLWFPKTNSGTKPENAKSQSKTHHIG